MREFDEGFDICPHCGYIVGTPAAVPYALPPGTQLADGRYLLGKVLGPGDFGITYIAWDGQDDRTVVVKECMPHFLVARIKGEKEIRAYNEIAQQQFDSLLEKTWQEAQTYLDLQNVEGLVRLYDCIEGNRTAYFVIEYLQGRTLRALLKEKNKYKLSFAETMQYMQPVLETLDAIHKAGMIYSHVTRDNIFLCDNGKVKLLDPLDSGAVGEFVRARRYETSCGMFHEYHIPPEMYEKNGKRGAWTDVYAASATMYVMLTGETPQDSLSRMIDDKDLNALPESDAPKSAQKAILHGMALEADQRIQSTKELLDALQKPAALRKKIVWIGRFCRGQGSTHTS